MKTFKITKEQILKLNSYNNYDCGVALKQWFPEAFKTELEVGEWYWASEKAKKDKTYLYCYQGIKSYGFDWLGNYRNDLCTGGSSDIILATEEEVKNALIAEAKKRGFKEGIFYEFKGEKYKAQGSIEFNHLGKLNDLYFKESSRFIFENGKWAEIISEPIELTFEQIAEKFNVNVEQIKIKK